VSPEITTIHKFYNTEFNSKYYYKLSLKVEKFLRVYVQQKNGQLLASIYDIMMKPVHVVNLSKHSEKFYLKTKPQARLSILILSKTDPSSGILSHLARHARFMKVLGFFCIKATKVDPYFHILAFNILV